LLHFVFFVPQFSFADSCRGLIVESFWNTAAAAGSGGGGVFCCVCLPDLLFVILQAQTNPTSSSSSSVLGMLLPNVQNDEG